MNFRCAAVSEWKASIAMAPSICGVTLNAGISRDRKNNDSPLADAFKDHRIAAPTQILRFSKSFSQQLRGKCRELRLTARTSSYLSGSQQGRNENENAFI